MKLLKYLSIILLVGLFLLIYGYLNLKVSYKYEVDLMETNIITDEEMSSVDKDKRLNEIKELGKLMNLQIKIVQISFLFFLFSLIVVFYYMYRKY